jgi:hypothetical protein
MNSMIATCLLVLAAIAVVAVIVRRSRARASLNDR